MLINVGIKKKSLTFYREVKKCVSVNVNPAACQVRSCWPSMSVPMKLFWLHFSKWEELRKCQYLYTVNGVPEKKRTNILGSIMKINV